MFMPWRGTHSKIKALSKHQLIRNLAVSSGPLRWGKLDGWIPLWSAAQDPQTLVKATWASPHLGQCSWDSADPFPPGTATTEHPNTAKLMCKWVKKIGHVFKIFQVRHPWTSKFSNSRVFKTYFSYQSMWTTNLELIQWWISDSETIRFSVVLIFIDLADTSYKHIQHLAAVLLSTPSQRSSFRSCRAPIRESQAPGRKVWCAAGIWPETWFPRVVSWAPRVMRQPFLFECWVLFHNLPMIPFTRAMLPGTSSWEVRRRKPGFGPPGCLRTSCPPAPFSQLTEQNPPTRKWFLFNWPQGQTLFPSDIKRQPPSPADHRPPGPLCQRWYHLTTIFTPEHSQPLFSSP